MKIKVGNHYRLYNNEVIKVIAIEGSSKYPVVGEIITGELLNKISTWKSNGRFGWKNNTSAQHSFDIKEEIQDSKELLRLYFDMEKKE